MTSYVWGVRYVDDLVLREKGSERIYSLADPNWNVIALIDASGAVVERMKYDAFGKITWLDAAFGAKTASGYGWNRTFTGQVFDSETGLMLYRERYYHAGFGRFVSRDPIGYRAGDANLYRMIFNQSLNGADPMGQQNYSVLGAFGVNPYDHSGNQARAYIQNNDPKDVGPSCCNEYRPYWKTYGSLERCINQETAFMYGNNEIGLAVGAGGSGLSLLPAKFGSTVVTRAAGVIGMAYSGSQYVSKKLAELRCGSLECVSIVPSVLVKNNVRCTYVRICPPGSTPLQ
jgi:RHS repeat-associated protein